MSTCYTHFLHIKIESCIFQIVKLLLNYFVSCRIIQLERTTAT
nr:MAG TPA: hypothetical protein [Caudoviricetes sp.]